MKKIGTHNSLTGEAGGGWLSRLLTPFARCQRKNLRQQYAAGCRYFDLRIRPAAGVWRGAHGPWTSRRTFADLLGELNALALTAETWVMITYEGACPDEAAFRDTVDDLMERVAPRLLLASVNVKKPAWHTLDADPDAPPHENAYTVLDGSTWHTLLPVPRLWAWLRQRKAFNERCYTFVDFL